MARFLLVRKTVPRKLQEHIPGEVSAWMVKSTGAEYVIIGHSERRSYYHEDDKILNKKTLLALNSGLKVIFCIGEVQSEREAGKHFLIVKRQLEEGLFTLMENRWIQLSLLMNQYGLLEQD